LNHKFIFPSYKEGLRKIAENLKWSIRNLRKVSDWANVVIGIIKKMGGYSYCCWWVGFIKSDSL
jgi:hypothetical protein